MVNETVVLKKFLIVMTKCAPFFGEDDKTCPTMPRRIPSSVEGYFIRNQILCVRTYIPVVIKNNNWSDGGVLKRSLSEGFSGKDHCGTVFKRGKVIGKPGAN